jgi:hypothetical protein
MGQESQFPTQRLSDRERDIGLAAERPSLGVSMGFGRANGSSGPVVDLACV